MAPSESKRIPTSVDTRVRLDSLGQFAGQYLAGKAPSHGRQTMSTPTAVRLLAGVAYAEDLPDAVPEDIVQFAKDLDAVAYDRTIEQLRQVPESRRNFFRQAQNRYADVAPVWASKAITKVHAQYMAAQQKREAAQ